MSENIVTMLLAVFPIALFMGGIALIGYISDEQEHRHKIELEKAKQGIFEQPNNEQSFFKKYCKQIIFTLILIIIVIGICYIFNAPSDLAKYILDIIK